MASWEIPELNRGFLLGKSLPKQYYVDFSMATFFSTRPKTIENEIIGCERGFFNAVIYLGDITSQLDWICGLTRKPVKNWMTKTATTYQSCGISQV